MYAFPFQPLLCRKAHRKMVKGMVEPIRYPGTQTLSLVVLVICSILPCSNALSPLCWPPSAWFPAPPLFPPALHAARVHSGTPTFTCAQEFYTTKRESVACFDNCHMVGELRAVHENITCFLLPTLLNLFINSTPVCFFPQFYVVNISLILLRTKGEHSKKEFIKDHAFSKFWESWPLPNTARSEIACLKLNSISPCFAWKIKVESLNYCTVCKGPHCYLCHGSSLWWAAGFRWRIHINSYLIERWGCLLQPQHPRQLCCFSLWGFILLINLHALSSHSREITYSLGSFCELQAEYAFHLLTSVPVTC